MKKKSDFIWNVIIITYFIVHISPFILAALSIISTDAFVWGFAAIILIAGGYLPIAIIEIIAILFYVIKQRPKGSAKQICYAALVFPVSYLFLLLVIYLINEYASHFL
jgi:hypothetical protein